MKHLLTYSFTCSFLVLIDLEDPDFVYSIYTLLPVRVIVLHNVGNSFPVCDKVTFRDISGLASFAAW